MKPKPVANPVLNPNYWDCECEVDYIHKRESKKVCNICESIESEQPDSHQSETEVTVCK